MPLNKVEIDVDSTTDLNVNKIRIVDSRGASHSLFRPTFLVELLNPDGNRIDRIHYTLSKEEWDNWFVDGSEASVGHDRKFVKSIIMNSLKKRNNLDIAVSDEDSGDTDLTAIDTRLATKRTEAAARV